MANDWIKKLIDGAILLVVYNLVLYLMGMVKPAVSGINTILDFGFGFLTLGGVITFAIALPLASWVNKSLKR